MKMNSLKAVAVMGLSALALGTAAAQTASKPVGYETLNFGTGFTPLGLRLHEAPTTSGTVASADATSITVTGADFGALLDSDTEYVLEIETATGIVQVVNAWAGDTITTPSDLSGEIAADGSTTFTIRPVATLASAFGNAVADVTLAQGGGAPGSADQIWVADGAGGYDKYYFDAFAPPSFAAASWAQIDAAGGGSAVDGTAINLLYADGFVINSQAGGSHVVTGSVKLSATELTLLSGFTFVSSVAPAGQTLETAFPAGGTLVQGGGAPGSADQLWIQNASGGYDKYYFDAFAPPAFTTPSWAQIDAAGGGSSVDGTTIELPAGYVVNSQAGGNITQGVPGFYASL